MAGCVSECEFLVLNVVRVNSLGWKGKWLKIIEVFDALTRLSASGILEIDMTSE